MNKITLLPFDSRRGLTASKTNLLGDFGELQYFGLLASKYPLDGVVFVETSVRLFWCGAAEYISFGLRGDSSIPYRGSEFNAL